MTAAPKDAIAEAHAAGIEVRMITGDHAVTAEAIARQLGIRRRANAGAQWAALEVHKAYRRRRAAAESGAGGEREAPDAVGAATTA